METIGIIILIVVIIGVISGILSWIYDQKEEGGLTGCGFNGCFGGIGCLHAIIPTLITIVIIMYCCS